MIFPVLTEQEMREADEQTLRVRVRQLSTAIDWLKSIASAITNMDTRMSANHSHTSHLLRELLEVARPTYVIMSEISRDLKILLARTPKRKTKTNKTKKRRHR